jgi:hypothetical protein
MLDVGFWILDLKGSPAADQFIKTDRAKRYHKSAIRLAKSKIFQKAHLKLLMIKFSITNNQSSNCPEIDSRKNSSRPIIVTIRTAHKQKRVATLR